MFKKILIANRGEIACRIIKTAQRLGIKTVAVYSDADRDARHVDMADEAIHIGPPEASQSYLVIDKIIEACRRSGAEAVHPGYGFLSEREAFALALQAARITFIGPNPHAIAAMGDKIESKKAAAKAGVSTVPGHLGVIADSEQAVRISDEIGYPVMIKASAGGGGKGMRIAYDAKEVREGFELASSEAKSSFGDDRVFVEKFIIDPRHIEIQVIGDKHGHVIHLGERECSIQRRNQKVIEEAPSPLLDAATRESMGAQAVALAKAVNYDSAGTVEFVAGQDKSFYFLEMNTRLQVEHPVTELVTGLDLVELMIRVAAGEPLPKALLPKKGSKATTGVTLKGWAVETRIYAEDPYRNFLPSIGRLTRYQPPREGLSDGITVRNDTGVREGDEISIYYDPMIAKLVTHAASRKEAIAAQGRALDAFAIAGIQHNIPFLSALMQHERFIDGRLSTGFIKEEFPAGFAPRAPDDDERDRLAAVAAMIDGMSNDRRKRISGQMRGRGYAFPPRRVVLVDGVAVDVTVASLGRDVAIDVYDAAGVVRRTMQVRSAWVPGQAVWQGSIDGQLLAVQVRPLLNGMQLAHAGLAVTAFVYTLREAALAALMPVKTGVDQSRSLLCPMPGLIKSLPVHEGQEVKAGEVLAVVEAMKMENQLRAERDVTVKKLCAKAGDTLAVDAVIMEFA